MQEHVSAAANALSTFCSGSCHAQCCKRGRITLSPAEAARFEHKQARTDGLCTIDLSKGCEHLESDKCAIYNERPRVCRDYPLFLRHKTLFVAAACPAVEQGLLEQPLAELQTAYPELRIIRQ